MAPNRLCNLIMNDSDFSDLDDELEIFQAVATYESERDLSSSRNRRTVINRNTFGAQNCLFDDYFAESPSPNTADVARLLAVGELQGFSGMLGSLDCMHWEWNNCPTTWQGMYTGHAHKPTIILEAVASYDLWIWHANFGLPGSHNDLNVLDRSSLFDEISLGRAPPVNYTINGNEYNMGYYLVDGIYPQWASFVKTIPSSQGKKIFFCSTTRIHKEGCRTGIWSASSKVCNCTRIGAVVG
ncbi:hypothetical protein RHGRI_026622 [Rhododendron griersonianum]|uniref:Uncharacterized protein n=1 Tax=Rhododendron griersonianum TaxID=479676 RepID=A0AAV6IZR2_9ERIC|nr:hypothetical protein RHGRI_026622 [Rhododendron griersonianum]